MELGTQDLGPMIMLHGGILIYIQLHWRQHQDQKVAALHMTSRKSSCTDLQSLSAFQAMPYGSRTTAFLALSVH